MNFKTELIDRVIPVLTLWIDKGVSCPADFDFDTCKALLRKVRDALVATNYLYSDECGKLQSEDIEEKYNEALEMRKEARKIFVGHYLDLWN